MKSKSAENTLTRAIITSLSHDGRGVTHIAGKTVFIEHALPEEEILFEYTRKRGSYDEGKLKEIIQPSPNRVKPKCQHYSLCGGCSLQHLDVDQQIKHKEKTVLELLKYQAHIEPLKVLPPLTASSWGYRHKGRLGVRFVPGKDKVLVGFREKNSRYLADLTRCEILHPTVGEHLTTLSQQLYTLKARDQIAQIEIAIDDQNSALIIRHLTELSEDDIKQLIELAKQHHFKLYLQPKGVESIHLIYPEESASLLCYNLTEFQLKMFFHPHHFTQINPDINQQMISQAIELLDLSPEDQVLDLFCGIGNFTLPIAKHCRQIVGVEGDESAINQAIYNSKINDIHNSEFYCENLFNPPFQNKWQRQYTKLILDPPRAGAKEIIPQLKLWNPRSVVYVSCNPTTLARDAAYLIDDGYRLEKIGVIDMFPHTQHVETMALFQKKK